MNRNILFFMGIAGMTVLSGCASNAVMNSGVTVSQRVYGRLGITGDENNYTIETGSELERLSIIGGNNIVTVQHGARLSKLEIWGSNNTVYLPKWLIVRRSIAGSNNQILETPWDENSYGTRGSGGEDIRIVPQQQQQSQQTYYYTPAPQPTQRYSSPPPTYSTGTNSGGYYNSQQNSSGYSQPGVLEMRPVN